MAGMLVLSDAVISSLGHRPDILRAFPFVRMHVSKRKSGCRCNQSAAHRKEMAKEAERVKFTLLNLPRDKQAQLKRMVSASQLVLYIRGLKGVRKHVI